jgi:hypothetical protein
MLALQAFSNLSPGLPSDLSTPGLIAFFHFIILTPENYQILNGLQKLSNHGLTRGKVLVPYS